ncbi:hypothetical protein [Paenibacillus xylanexedens]|uniref:hypothetical protein n=1 Tax=Paenibacillus xylanexedens TaxID=528191 RepID=UPI0011A700FA|nr:hypothetical protein [Paenibacillus xylanexedens]
MDEIKVKAKTKWVWTELAQRKNPNHSRAGDPIWPHFQTEAPKQWLDDGLIQDETEVVKEGQMSIFDY